MTSAAEGSGKMDDLISRKALCDYALNQKDKSVTPNDIMRFPSAQPDVTDINVGNTISRQAAIDALADYIHNIDKVYSTGKLSADDCKDAAKSVLDDLPSAQSEMRHCVNCGRTVNNGGWYKDGRTRCPIEEHYQLPKDGYCHLWEKRNVTDDDYPERREE
jgi:hypothetical protein